MLNFMDLLKGTLFDALLLLMTICSEMKLSSAEGSNTSYPAYTILEPNKGSSASGIKMVHNIQTDIAVLTGNRHSHVDHEHINALEVIWLNSSTDTISVKWKLADDYNVTGYIKESRVEYFPTGGRFTSHPLNRKIREYTFINLDAGSIYTICVYMTEMYGEENGSSILHSKCVKINTIEYIRRDSAIIMLLSLSYYAFMGLLGYTQWKRKLWAFQRRCKNRAKGSNCEDTTQNCKMRWKDLVEKERLVAKPGCSIECNDT